MRSRMWFMSDVVVKPQGESPSNSMKYEDKET
jgi:hypothetical protein